MHTCLCSVCLQRAPGEYKEDVGVIGVRNEVGLALLLSSHHETVMNDAFMPSVCTLVTLLTHKVHSTWMCACRVWLMCVIISQLANIYTRTPSFVAYLDWQRCGPDWLVSLRTTWDRFVWLGTLKYGEHDWNYIVLISPLVGLNDFGSTSFTQRFLR